MTDQLQPLHPVSGTRTVRNERLRADSLICDATVQRPLDRTRAKRIADTFEPRALGTIHVSDRTSGQRHIIDGNHRVNATLMVNQGDRLLDCRVYTGLTLADEAGMFRLLNNTKTVQPVDRFRVRVVEGDPVATQLSAILRGSGWTVAMNKADGVFAAVVALEGVYRGREKDQANNVVCKTLITAITAAWGHNSDGVRAELIAGIGGVIARYGNQLDLPKLIDQLGSYSGGPRRLVGDARNLQSFRGGRLADSVAEIVVGLVNKHRRTNRLADWRDAA